MRKITGSRNQKRKGAGITGLGTVGRMGLLATRIKVQRLGGRRDLGQGGGW